jgi:hypothetical protein
MPTAEFRETIRWKSVFEARSRLPRSQKSGLGAQKGLDGTVREDTIPANETE